MDQTGNAIQNIILQEMETLDGILVATTNLSRNFAPAFERRFIYKIEFEKPDPETRALIWRSMISGLCETDARELARRFELSGGQIENIARKSTVHRVLSGGVPAWPGLVRFCEDETAQKESGRTIGFAVPA